MKILFAGVASIALVWAGQVHAQAAPAVQDATAGEQSTSAVADEQGASSDDIVVTAQKRSERLVDVPATVTILSAESIALAGQDSLDSLNKLVPGLYINQPVYFLSPTIRGVGSTLSVTNESIVSVYVDGVYQPAQAGNVFDLASVSDIEVLKGPQGTLFGRNATGGAILVSTLDPSPDREAKFNLSYARFGEVRANGYVNLPIAEGIAANVAISRRYSPGFIRDVRTGELRNEAKSFSVRGKLLLEPADNLDIILTAGHNQLSDPTASNYQSLNGVNRFSAVPGAGPLAVGPFQVSHNTRDIIETSGDEYTARIMLDTEAGQLTSITARKLDHLYASNDIDNSYLNAGDVNFVFKQRTVTQEINFTSRPGGAFGYVVGAYYYRNYRYYPSYNYLGFRFLYQDNTNEALAGYVDGTYEFGDLTAIAGIRYSTEKRELNNALYAPLAAPSTASVQTRDDAWTPRFGLRYAISPRSNLYATYSRGFKSGAFNGTSPTGAGVKPETINAFEVGYKLSDSALKLNAAAYYYDYTNIQASTLLIVNNIATTVLSNAGKARIYGAELDATYAFNDAFNVRAAFSYTNARYTDFPNATGYSPLPGGGYTTGIVDATGNSMVRQPEYQASVQMNYIVPVGDNALTFTLSPSYNSRIYFDFASQLSQKPTFLLDGSVNLALGDGLSLSVFGRNILDRRYFSAMGFSTSDISVMYGTPATYGVRLSYAFN
jgi:iron complex outermembrane receptor protein